LSRPVFLFADQIRVDVFTKPWGLKSFEESWTNRLTVQVEGGFGAGGTVSIPVVSLEDLERSKSTDRPQDKADLEGIRALLDQQRRGDR